MEIDNQPNQPTGSQNPPQSGGPEPMPNQQTPQPTPQGPLPPMPQDHQASDQAQQPAQHKTDVLGIISLVMIIVFPLVGMILGFVGINKAKKEGYPKTLSMIGAVINTILVVLGVLAIILIFVLAANSDTDLSQDTSDFESFIGASQEEAREVEYVSDVANICTTKKWPTNLTSSTTGNVVGVFSNSQSFPDTYSTEYVTLEDEFEDIDSSNPTEVDTIVCVSSVDQEAARIVECDLTVDDQEVKAPMSLRPYEVVVYDAATQNEIGTFMAQPEERCPFFVTVNPEDNSFDANLDEDSFNSGLAGVL